MISLQGRSLARSACLKARASVIIAICWLNDLTPMFKFLGAFFGFFSLGFIGAAFGFVMGSIIDRSLRLGVGAVNPLSAKSRQHSFLKTLFQLMGKLAKADGHISQQEIDGVESFIRQLGMEAAHRQEAIDYFKQGAQAGFDVHTCLAEFKQHCGQTKHLNQTLLSYLIALAMADGVLDSAEESLLIEIAKQLGITAQELQQLMAMIGAQNQFANDAAQQGSLEQAYAALGVSESDSDKDIKRAYRQLRSKYHPDKLIGQGLPEDMVKEATERSQEIRSAYEMIQKQRGH